MNNPEIAAIFNRIADILEIQNENPFRIRSYRNAALTIESLPHELHDLDEDKLKEIPGIGEGIAGKIKELFATGKMKFYEDLRKKIPPGLIEMTRITGVGPKTAKKLWEELGIKSVDQLEKAAQQNKIQELKGLGAKVQENILRGIELRRKHTERHTLAQAVPLADELLKLLREKAPVEKIEIAGSLRRMRGTIGDIDILAASKKPDKVMEVFTQLPMVIQVLGKGETKSSVHLKFNMTEDEMTRRIMKAMENPLVTVIGHPTGRLIGRREPYKVNMERLLDKAKETGTFMELNAYWDRLDLNDVHVRMAKEKGVKIMIDTDAHNDTHFEMMRHGVATARRGWLEAKDVVNTLPTVKFLEAIRAKRERRK